MGRFFIWACVTKKTDTTQFLIKIKLLVFVIISENLEPVHLYTYTHQFVINLKMERTSYGSTPAYPHLISLLSFSTRMPRQRLNISPKKIRVKSLSVRPFVCCWSLFLYWRTADKQLPEQWPQWMRRPAPIIFSNFLATFFDANKGASVAWWIHRF